MLKNSATSTFTGSHTTYITFHDSNRISMIYFHSLFLTCLTLAGCCRNELLIDVCLVFLYWNGNAMFIVPNSGAIYSLWFRKCYIPPENSFNCARVFALSSKQAAFSSMIDVAGLLLSLSLCHFTYLSNNKAHLVSGLRSVRARPRAYRLFNICRIWHVSLSNQTQHSTQPILT